MISVALATYNGEKYVEEQLQSILNQTRNVDEIIVVDDYSQDNTVEIVKQVLSLASCNVKIVQNEQNLGYKKNFHKAVSFCRGDFVFLCDQDDYWHQDKVSRMMQILENDEKMLCLASSFSLIDGKGYPKVEEENPLFSNHNLYRVPVKKGSLVQVPFDEMLIQNGFQGCALCIKREIVDLFVNHFTDELFHDWLINLYASMKNGLYFLNEELFDYRIHEKNTIGIVEDEGLNKMERLKKTNTLHQRTLFAKSCLQQIDVLKQQDVKVELYQPDIDKKRLFYQEHVLNLENGHPLRLLFSNFSPYYGLIKTRKARVMDIVFALARRMRIR